MATETREVIIIGAGISGINAAYRIKSEFPDLDYTILEARDRVGGTWDLFKYPGIRSDSDLHTFGFEWRPWHAKEAIASGREIANYVKECAEVEGIYPKIQFHHQIIKADWSSDEKLWTIEVKADGQTKTMKAGFLVCGTGYYDYHKPLQTKIPGIENFQGQVVHPQFWPEDLDYKDKNVVIIGSGATAITLLPNLVDKASHVTMLQRSPGYILSRPSVDPMGVWAHKWLPSWLAYRIVRMKSLIIPFLFFKFCRSFPNAGRSLLQKGVKQHIPKDMPLDPDFSPNYNPWEQRLCVCPDADFFNCLKSGKADIVTGHIEQVSEKSITLKKTGITLHPDIIVTATGLKIQVAGGVHIIVDGAPLDVNKKFLWKNALLQDLPNACIILGYTNASWTLGADATAFLVCRILRKMRKEGKKMAVPRLADQQSLKIMPAFNLNSTYVENAKGDLPMAGDKGPWRARDNYFTDMWAARHASITDGMVYS